MYYHRRHFGHRGPPQAPTPVAAPPPPAVTHASAFGTAVERKRHRVALLEEPLSRSVYQMMIAQLYHDGFSDAAESVAASTGCSLSNVQRGGPRLERLVANGLAVESAHALELRSFVATEVVEKYLARCAVRIPTHMQAAQLRSVYSVANMRERFSSSSIGGVVRALALSPDGSLLLAGGNNKVGARLYSVQSLLSHANASDLRTANALHAVAETRGEGNQQGHSAALHANAATALAEVRHFAWHRISVESVAFHPREPLALTGGREGDVFLWSYGEPAGVEQPKSILQDTFAVRALDFSPTGDYALIGTDHASIRLAHVASEKLLTPPHTCHTAAFGDVSFRSDGRVFAAANFDGHCSVNDLASGKAAILIHKAHSGVPVTSCCFSRTGNILLTYGMDSVARLWDLRRLSESSPVPVTLAPTPVAAALPAAPHAAGHLQRTRMGAPGAGASVAVQPPQPPPVEMMPAMQVPAQTYGIPAKCEHRLRARFNSHESLILAQDSSLCAVQAFDVYSGEVVYSCAVAQHPQRAFAVGSYAPILVTGGDDCRLRLWTASTIATSS